MSLPRIIVLGAGLGGTIAAYEIREATKGRAEVMVVSDTDDYWFVPSNPWVAVRWREPDAIRVHLPPVMKKRGIGFTNVGCTRVHPTENRLDLGDGVALDAGKIAAHHFLGQDLAPGWIDPLADDDKGSGKADHHLFGGRADNGVGHDEGPSIKV